MDVDNREPFSGGSQAYSGARLERALTPEGQRVVLKHLPADGDWLTRATDGHGRARRLWESGALDAVAGTMEHSVIDVCREDDHDVVVMADVSEVLLPPDARVARAEVECLLAGLARLHADFEDAAPGGLCTPARRHSLFLPSFQRADDGPHPCRVRSLIVEGWELLAERWPGDVVHAVFAVHDALGLLERELLRTAPSTLLHGDAKLDNLGLRGDRVVAVDWGELTGFGPAEMDVVWFAATSTLVAPEAPTWRIDAMPDEVFAVYNAKAARPLDPRTLDLACLGIVAQLGWYLQLGDGAARERTAQLDAWWKARVLVALETWSPV